MQIGFKKFPSPKVLLRILLPLLWVSRHSYQGTLKELRTLRKRLFTALALIPIISVIHTAVPLMFKKLNDLVIGLPSHPIPERDGQIPLEWMLVGGVGVYAFIWTLEKIIGNIKEIIFCPLVGRAIRTLTLKAFQGVHAMDDSQQAFYPTGWLVSATKRISRSLYLFLSITLFRLAPLLLQTFMGAGVLLYFYHWIYPVLLAFLMVISLTFSLWAGFYYHQFRRRANQAGDQASAAFADSFLNRRPIKYHHTAQEEARRFNEHLFQEEKMANKAYIRYQITSALEGSIIGIGLLGILGITVWDISHHLLQSGDFILIHGYIISLARPIRLLSIEFKQLIEASADIEEILPLINDKPPQWPSAKEIILPLGALTVENMSFQYPNTGRCILKKVNFKIQEGETLWIQGATGSGKSTLVHLMTGLLSPTSGKIVLGGRDLKTLSPLERHQFITIVPQVFTLFNNTVLFNLTYGCDKVSFKRVAHITRCLGLESFIRQLPQGYHTPVGEEGVRLSGGQRQLIAIARALLCKRNIFVFDEATSALDSAHEKKVLQKIQEEIPSQALKIFVTHRPLEGIKVDHILTLA